MEYNGNSVSLQMINSGGGFAFPPFCLINRLQTDVEHNETTAFRTSRSQIPRESDSNRLRRKKPERLGIP